MTDHKASSENSARRRTLLAGMITLGVLGPLQKAKGAQERRFLGQPIVVRMGERICINLANADNQPIGVKFFLLEGYDFEALASSAAVTLAPRTGTYWETHITADALVLPAMDIVSPRDPASGLPTGIRAAVQHRNFAGETLSYYKIDF